MKTIQNAVSKALVIAVLLFPGIAHAGNTLEVAVDVEIPQVVNVSWSVDGSTVDLTGVNAITVAEFVQGYKDAIAGGTIECTANEAFDVTVESVNMVFSGGSGSKAIQSLKVDVDNSNTYPFTMLDGTSPVTIYNEQGATQGELHPIKYKLFLYSDDSPGTYSTTLTYTIFID